ncbi:hypothetical protein OAC87_04075 [Pseudomonadales bacterium]|nr:hypothetical protein [Pseudomonadales bacterium]
MPYQGNTPVESYIATVKDSFSGNGSTTAFTMSKPTQVNDVRVVVENVIQDPSVAYTVSGTTITFTSAPPSGTNNIYVIHLGPAVATAQPPAEIADATTFASNVSVQGSFTSPGIDDNADATALTIDSSEVVLVGKTSNTFSQQGVALRANNDSQITRDGGNPLSLNRTSSDGDIAKFFKDGTAVGSVGAHSSGTYLGTADTGIYFNGGNDSIDPYNPSVPINRDNAISLGAGSRRFRNLYLSGGVFLGGTTTANKLSDYEEGTWTPAFVSGTFSYGIRTGWYTKVGDLVTCGFLIIWSSKSGSGTINITLPFTTSSGTHYRYAGSTGYMSGVDIGSSYKDFTFTTTPSTANVALVLNGDNIAGAGAQIANMSGSGEVQGSLSFKV